MTDKNLEQMLYKFIDQQKTAFIASIDGEGFPNLKAMLAPRRRVGLKEFWFTTNTSSRRVAQYRIDSRAAVYFCDNRVFCGIMLRGRMEVLEDAATKQLIWRDGDTVYHSGGVTDPDYCVLKFTAECGRCYVDFSSRDFSVE